MKKFGKAVITCLEHGCTNTIAYDNEDYEVPLYCAKHRTEDGRHSQTRVLREPQKKIVSPMVEFKCPTCRLKKEICKVDFVLGVEVLCNCGSKMKYHGDVKMEA